MNVGPISPTSPNLIDVSASSTPGLCDPTNPSVASYAGALNPTAYYRSVAEVDARGHISYTDGDVYSGDNSRAVIRPTTVSITRLETTTAGARRRSRCR